MLTEKFKDRISTLLLPPQCFNPYPKYEDRKKWDSIPDDIKQAMISRGEKYLDYRYKAILASDLLDIANGDDKPQSISSSIETTKVLSECVLAECVEGKGRFMMKIIDGIMIKSEESWWNVSANAYMHTSWPCKLPDVEDPIIDLHAALIATVFSYAYYFLGSEFDKIDKNINKRIKYEVKRRILKPFYESKDIWWMAYRREVNPVMNVLHPINNWTPYCTAHCLNAILLLEDDCFKRIEGVKKSMEIIDNYFNYYSDDGCCDEGIGYWFMAPGSLGDYLCTLMEATNGEVTVFDNEKIRRMGDFVYNAYIGKNYFINYADARAIHACLDNRIVQYAKATNNDRMLRFGLKFYNRESYFNLFSTHTDFLNTLYYMFNHKLIENHFYLNDFTKEDYLINENYYDLCQVFTAREVEGSDKGFFLSCKGGHNDESHNHNDVGNYIIFKNAEPVIIDAGVGMYSKQTFSKTRYDLWTHRSKYHNVPLVNNMEQPVGRKYKAKNVHYINEAAKCGLSLDLTGVYPENAGISYYRRTISLEKKPSSCIVLEEEFKMFSEDNTVIFTFLTPHAAVENIKGELILCNTVLLYDCDRLEVSYENIVIDDPALIPIWGKNLSKISLTTKKAFKNHTYVFKFV
ncbi:MAG: heparinase II/III family protein [Clostridia bacterium]|nr:heparinase II/III family protein [Clostridia bacterium]